MGRLTIYSNKVQLKQCSIKPATQQPGSNYISPMFVATISCTCHKFTENTIKHVSCSGFEGDSFYQPLWLFQDYLLQGRCQQNQQNMVQQHSNRPHLLDLIELDFVSLETFTISVKHRVGGTAQICTTLDYFAVNDNVLRSGFGGPKIF